MGWVVMVAVVGFLLWRFQASPHLDLSVTAQYLFNENILHGLGNTLLIAFWAEILALILGVVVGFGRMSKNSAAATGSWTWVWLLRSTPLIVQILLWGNLALFFPVIGFGSWSVETNDVLTPFLAGVIALGLHESAYVAESVRGGMLAVPATQWEAARALGLSRWQTQRKVIFPQALRVMVPPLGNALVLLLKSTSLVVVIAGGDLLTEAQNISAVNLRTLELLVVATLWFLAVTSVASVGQSLLERRLNRQNRAPARGDEGSP